MAGGETGIGPESPIYMAWSYAATSSLFIGMFSLSKAYLLSILYTVPIEHRRHRLPPHGQPAFPVSRHTQHRRASPLHIEGILWNHSTYIHITQMSLFSLQGYEREAYSSRHTYTYFFLFCAQEMQLPASLNRAHRHAFSHA